MDYYFEFLVLLFIFGVGTRVIFQIWKSFRHGKYIEKREDILGPIAAAFLVMLGIGFSFNVFDFFSLRVPFFTGIVITIFLIAQVSWETHDIIRWFESRLWGGIIKYSDYSSNNSKNNSTDSHDGFSDEDGKG